ncbi:MAG: ASCH domain-containing protein [Anaerosomatales bacterium]|nr:ASCH domain-containing protein [Anaerosomatales bacterium]
MSESAAQMWETFVASGLPDAPDAETPYTAWHFGTGGAMADELAELVLAGRKRATAGALWSYEHEGESIPEIGEYSVILDGSGRACCIIRTTAVEVVPFDGVSAPFAATEGEGDGSLAYWREGHWHYFTGELAEFGRTPEHDMPVVCETFEMVWPPNP